MPDLTQKQRERLDDAVFTHIRDNPGVRTMDLLEDPKIRKVLDSLPKGKEDFRYLDNSLQRLRKASKIEASSNRWSLVTS